MALRAVMMVVGVAVADVTISTVILTLAATTVITTSLVLTPVAFANLPAKSDFLSSVKSETLPAATKVLETTDVIV